MNMFIKKENLVKFLDLLKCHTFNTLIGIGDDCSFNSALELLKNEIENAFKLKNKDFDIATILTEFKNSYPKLKEYLVSDLNYYYDSDPASEDINDILLSYPGFLATFIYRISHILYKLNVPYIPRMLSEHAHFLTGIDINPGATIGKNFFIDHGTGIVIGETSIIGDNVKIYQGVTIGALSLKRGQKLKGTKRHPTIGNNCTIYAGASILGGDTVIGDNCIIGANVFIFDSVSENSIVKLSKKNYEIIKKI